MSDKVLIQVRDLEKHFGSGGTIHALDGVSADISRGEVVGFGVIDVCRNDGTSGSNFFADKFGSDI